MRVSVASGIRPRGQLHTPGRASAQLSASSRRGPRAAGQSLLVPSLLFKRLLSLRQRAFRQYCDDDRTCKLAQPSCLSLSCQLCKPFAQSPLSSWRFGEVRRYLISFVRFCLIVFTGFFKVAAIDVLIVCLFSSNIVNHPEAWHVMLNR